MKKSLSKTFPLMYRHDSTNKTEEQSVGTILAKEFELPLELGKLLYRRGITNLEDAQNFLHPKLAMLPDPQTMLGMGEAISCLIEGIRTKKPIYIHGDFDADGICSTALFVSFLKEIGHEHFYYIPNRLIERYGLSQKSLDQLLAKGQGKKGIVVSVDCGITAIEEVEYLRSLGFSCIITDHHEAPANLPKAEAILNPKQKNCSFPCSFLSGVGVAFFLLMGLRKALNIQINLKKYLDLVAIGTIADVVPLLGVNRILVKVGLEVLYSTKRFGVFSLCEAAGLSNQRISSEDIAFRLAPRINAAGRLGNPDAALALLLAENLPEARTLALKLDGMNNTRKQIESDVFPQIQEQCEIQKTQGRNALCVYQADCHPGVAGIVAARIVEQFHLPTLIFADDVKKKGTDILRGSGRSIPGINLFRVLEACSEYIEQFGGHPMAVGLTLPQSQFEAFSIAFNQQIQAHKKELEEACNIIVDCKIDSTTQLSSAFTQAVQKLQPFGEGNPEPVFFIESQKMLAPRIHPNGHVLFRLQGNGQFFDGVGFHLAKPELDLNKEADLVVQLKRSWFRGVERDQIYTLHILSY